MSTLASKYFGELDYAREAVYTFEAGIPGFEEHSEFVFLEKPHTNPLVFMQSLQDPELCFIAVSPFVADAMYQLQLSPDDLRAIGSRSGDSPKIGADITCFVLVTVTPGADPTVNLASPVVLNLHTRKGTQVIPESSRYSCRHPLIAGRGQPQCS